MLEYFPVEDFLVLPRVSSFQNQALNAYIGMWKLYKNIRVNLYDLLV